MSGSISNRGAALFNKPTSSSNSDANTDEGSLMEAVCMHDKHQHKTSACHQNTSGTMLIFCNRTITLFVVTLTLAARIF
uniref:Uncharacterized protein n=1 Tax=Sinocyclocheilus grahami TaxID=75366 RepID=A0A672KHP5_SINGR